MASTTFETRTETTSGALLDTLVYGAVAGIIGGAVFGVMMATMNMLPMVAALIGSESVVIGFIVHLVISAVIGVSYGFVARFIPASWPLTIGAGIFFGLIWWVLGALVAMPIMLGMGEMVLVIEDMQLMSLIGHIIFGIVTAAFYLLMKRQ